MAYGESDLCWDSGCGVTAETIQKLKDLMASATDKFGLLLPPQVALGLQIADFVLSFEIVQNWLAGMIVGGSQPDAIGSAVVEPFATLQLEEKGNTLTPTWEGKSWKNVEIKPATALSVYLEEHDLGSPNEKIGLAKVGNAGLVMALAAGKVLAVPTQDQPPGEILFVHVSVTPTKKCGDGTCESTETAVNCPSDCNGPLCNNGKCEAGETSASCPWDCKPGASGPVCGDGKCDTGEATTCAKDCSTAVCGNSKCEAGEVASCPKDCQSSTNNSCAGYCTKQAPGGCWCDDACAQNGDCCSDKAMKCNAGCQGKCGGESFEVTGKQCYCDSICVQNNDCCADKKTYCP